MEWGKLLAAVFAGLSPVLPQLIGGAAFLLVLVCPMPGRGLSAFHRQDPWRRFKYEARRVVMSRAGNRCEGAVFLAWGRCAEPAIEADHVYPWSRSGPTTVGNGQALCGGHNRRKAAWKPAWWYLMSLERRRCSYFPPATDVRVMASMSTADLEARATSARSKASR